MTTDEEIFQIHHDRLLEAEGKIFALTHLLRELLDATIPAEVIKTRPAVTQEAIKPAPTTDDDTIKFVEAARSLFNQVASGEDTPTRPTFTVVRGGKKTRQTPRIVEWSWSHDFPGAPVAQKPLYRTLWARRRRSVDILSARRLNFVRA
jgi:hypothetical protein